MFLVAFTVSFIFFIFCCRFFFRFDLITLSSFIFFSCFGVVGGYIVLCIPHQGGFFVMEIWFILEGQDGLGSGSLEFFGTLL